MKRLYEITRALVSAFVDLTVVVGPDLLAELFVVGIIMVVVVGTLVNLPSFVMARGDQKLAIAQYDEPLDERVTRAETEYDDVNRRVALDEVSISQINVVLSAIQNDVHGLQQKEDVREKREQARDDLYTKIVVRSSLSILLAAFSILCRVGWDMYKRVMFPGLRRIGDSKPSP